MRLGCASLLLGLLASGVAIPDALAGDREPDDPTPLSIRIRPLGPPGAFDPALPEGDPALAARAAFDRCITERANRAIASVCAGCLAPASVIDESFPAHARGDTAMKMSTP